MAAIPEPAFQQKPLGKREQRKFRAVNFDALVVDALILGPLPCAQTTMTRPVPSPALRRRAFLRSFDDYSLLTVRRLRPRRAAAQISQIVHSASTLHEPEIRRLTATAGVRLKRAHLGPLISPGSGHTHLLAAMTRQAHLLSRWWWWWYELPNASEQNHIRASMRDCVCVCVCYGRQCFGACASLRRDFWALRASRVFGLFLQFSPAVENREEIRERRPVTIFRDLPVSKAPLCKQLPKHSIPFGSFKSSVHLATGWVAALTALL